MYPAIINEKKYIRPVILNGAKRSEESGATEQSFM
jgi:hypothetical protein